MGAWGTSLYANDTTSDIRDDYIALLREGKSNEEATDELIEKYHEIMGDDEEEPLFWFALADTQWNYGRLMPSVKQKALVFLEQEGDLTLWIESGNNTNTKAWIHTRTILKEKLHKPQPPEKKVQRYRLYHCKWKIGDVYAYRMESEYSKKRGLYGKYIVFRKIDETTTWPGHTIPVVNIYEWMGETIPDIEEVKKWQKLLSADYAWGSVIRFHHRFSISTSSSRSIPKKQLFYLGNIDFLDSDEENRSGQDELPLYWETMNSAYRIEEEVIDLYLCWSLPEPQYEGSSLYRRLKLRE